MPGITGRKRTTCGRTLGWATTFGNRRRGPSGADSLIVPVRGWRQVAAHVTVGSARCTYLTAIEAEALELVMFSPAELNVCHHGNNGTATNHLKRWTV